MALDAGPFIRTGTRGSPSWPGSNPETGYVDADCSDQSAEAACRRGGPYVDGTLCGLAVDDRRRRARLAACVLPHLHIERVVDALQRPVPVPQVEVLPDGAARRQVLRQRLPLTPRPEHIKDRVEDLTNVHRSRAAAALGRTDRRGPVRWRGGRERPATGQLYPSERGACGQAPSCQRHSRTRRAKPPFDGTLCGLAVDDRRRRARLAACVLPHLNIERVVDALQRPVPVPQVEVLPDGAARRQVLRQRLPLTPRPEHIKDRVEDLTNVHRSRAAAALGRTDQRSHQRPFGVRQITLVTQAAPVGRRSMFRLPHEAPPNQVPFKESQAIPAPQVLSGTALTCCTTCIFLSRVPSVRPRRGVPGL